jgi:glycosyltransferase involved in cell wall biosynthesis
MTGPTPIFDGLAFSHESGRVEVRFPAGMHDEARASALARAHGVDLDTFADGGWRVRAASQSRCPTVLKAFFAALGGFPPPYPDAAVPACAGEPLLSCIVVVNENALFVREQLLPSLAAHRGRHAIEVVLVHNGAPPREAPPPGVRVVRAPWGAVSSAYNAGAACARGEVLALLHDDCIIDEPDWIDRSLAALERGAGAVAGEFRRLESIAGVPVPPLPVAKCVPLVVRRADFRRAGGFDEFHYVGYEDLDFTLALARLGKPAQPVELRLRHFDGMSSTLKYCPIPGLDALYALAAVPRRAILRRFAEFAASGRLSRGGVDYLRAALDAQLFHVLMKHRDFLASLHPTAYAEAAERLAGALGRTAAPDASQILPRFRALDRELAGASAA